MNELQKRAYMGVTLQAGFLASCVVFGPMAMAGWHLTRNRVLFFSGSLFIVLAVSVHVFPYFPVFSFYSPATEASVELTSSNYVNATLSDYCISNLHKVEFPETSKSVTPNSNQTDWDHWDWRWKPQPLHQCKYQKLDREEALELLQGTWIVVAGDSQARLLFVALLELTLPSIEPLRPLLFKRHSNFEHSLESHRILMEFVWAPYTLNLTQMVQGYGPKSPDIIVSGAGLWHMLHSGNHTQYGSSLLKFRGALRSLLKHPKEALTPQLFWMNLPTLVPSHLQSELKRERMTNRKLQLYAKELLKSKISGPRGLTTLLDIQFLSHQCGTQCTLDGIHYSQAVYRAALHVMINNLLIVTKQTPVT